MNKRSLGGKYVRKDGTTIASDKRDHRRKDWGHDGASNPNEYGTQREFEGSVLRKITLQLPNGQTRTTTAYSLEEARIKVGAPVNSKIVKDEPVTSEKRKRGK